MDLLERYLQAVRFFLPQREQDDIVRELSENLVSEMEDRQRALGRALTEDEQANILRRHGHPMLVAARYYSHQQLIGPAFFPIYLFALKVGLAAAAIVTAVLAAVTAGLYGDPIRHTIEAFLGLPGRALMVFAWTTLVFAALDMAQSRLRLAHKWDPRTLPKVVSSEDRLSRVHSVCELMASAAGIVWLLLVPATPFLLLGPAAAFVDFAEVWHVVYLPIVLLATATASLSLASVIRPYWTPLRSLLRVALQGATVVIAGVLLRAGEWVKAKPGLTPGEGVRLDGIVDLVNGMFAIGLAAAIAIAVFETGRELWRLKARRRQSSDSRSAPAGITRSLRGR